jgi:UDP-glucose 4-epimerase
MNILVTGGLGFIGSHTLVELVENNHDVIIVDNLVNSSIDVLDKIEQIIGHRPTFYQSDVTDERRLKTIFEHHKIDGVIHFAGLKSVGESVSKPLEYYYNNLVSTIVLSKLCLNYGVRRFVFSSSATVYGDQPSPLKEDIDLKLTTNPYGETKAMCERILKDTAAANVNFTVSILRYFNPIGAHESGLIGENPNGIPNNLMPYITRVAKGELKILSIFGNDYDTIDGTGVRDYIHVVDLAKGHVKAIENQHDRVNIYNLGTGRGTSVLELVNTFKKINEIEVPYEIVSRRPGDLATCFADASKAEAELGWMAILNVEDMVRDAWKFELMNKKQ